MSYFSNMLNDNDGKRTVIVKAFKRVIKQEKVSSLVGTGLSGAVGCSILGYHYNLPMLLIRKDTDCTHGGHFEESDGIRGNICVVDDLISRGKTVNKIIEEIKENQPNTHVIKAIFLYQTSVNNSTEILLEKKERGDFKDIPIYTFGDCYQGKMYKITHEIKTYDLLQEET